LLVLLMNGESFLKCKIELKVKRARKVTTIESKAKGGWDDDWWEVCFWISPRKHAHLIGIRLIFT